MSTRTRPQTTPRIAEGTRSNTREIISDFIDGKWVTRMATNTAMTQLDGMLTLFHFMTPIAVLTPGGDILINPTDYGRSTKTVLGQLRNTIKRQGWMQLKASASTEQVAMGMWAPDNAGPMWEVWVQER